MVQLSNVWTQDADGVYRRMVGDRAVWVWRSEPGSWTYGTTTRMGVDHANKWGAPRKHLAMADCLAFVAKLDGKAIPDRIMQAGELQRVWDVHPAR